MTATSARVLVGSALAFAIGACGGGGNGSAAGFVSAPASDSDAGAQSPPDDAAGTADATRAGPPSGDPGLVASDATAAACVPGTYAGTFDCTVTAFFDIVQIPWSGSLSLTFVGQSSTAGEFTMLTIAPGAHLSGTDQYGGTFGADLSGTLDCATQKLTGTLQNGRYQLQQGIANVDITFTGDLAGDYDGNATPPAFPTGTMGPLESADLGGDAGLVGTCTWSAALTP